MKNVEEIVESGILEQYVLGLLSEEEAAMIVDLSKKHPKIAENIEEINDALVLHAEDLTPALDVTIKPMLLASVDYIDRLKKGEVVSHPPQLSASSKVEDFSLWLNRPDFQLPPDFDQFHSIIIGNERDYTTAIVWLQSGAPREIHSKQIEKFLILEGTCEIVYDDGKVYSLSPGLELEIPVNMGHSVKVTSDCPCKFILQRVAA